MTAFRGVGRKASAVLALTALGACSEDPKEEGFLDAARIDARVQDAAVNDGGGGAGGGGGEVTVHTRLSMLKRVRPGSGAGALDLVIYDIDDDREANLTASAGGAVDCSVRCALNRQMTSIGWLQRGAGAGNELWVAPIDTVHFEVKIDEKRKVADTVQHFEFTNDGKRDLVVSMQGEAIGPEGQYQVMVEPVAAYDQAACEAGGDLEDLSACPQLAGAVNINGGFRVTPFGSLIILLRTDLSSMTISFFNVSNGASQALDTFGSMNGTGSQFAAGLPVGLSPDASYLAVFTRDEFLWKIHNLQAIPNPPDPVRLELFETEGDRMGDCQRPKPFDFNVVQFDPRFDATGEHVFFMATGDCSKQNAPGVANRDDYDILRVDKSMAADSVVSVTKNLRSNSWANHEITSYDLSKDGKRLVFTAPRPNDNANRSVWMIDADPAQAFPEYICGKNSMPVAAEDGQTRCEFLFDAVPDADVYYESVRFHEVEVRQ
jgi:hypothetical protein